MKLQKISYLNSKIRFTVLSLMLVLCLAGSSYASDNQSDKFNASEMIIHHISDSHEWHLATVDGHHYSIPLLIILYTEGNLDMFLSSDFHHGEKTVEKGDRIYKFEHEHITDVNGKKVLDFSITKNVASMMIAAIVLILIFISVGRGFKVNKGRAPRGIQSFFEPLIIFIRDEVALPNIGKEKYQKYLPYLLTVFFFIWLNNIFGLVPTGANASGNIAFTMTLAVITALITNFSGNKNYWGHIFWTPGVPFALRIIMLPVELIGILTKPFALMIRLFANITAGHIIILSLLSFIFIFKSFLVGIPVGGFVVVMMFLELFVAALQAYIFTLLSALFIGTAVEVHHDHH